MIGYLCKSLRIISLVWPTRLIFLAMGEVLSFGFNLAVSFPSDSRGSKARIVWLPSRITRWFFLSYCMNLSLYIMSSCLRRYSVFLVISFAFLLCFYFTLHLYHKNTKNIILSYLSDLTLVCDHEGIDNPLSRWLRGFICLCRCEGLARSLLLD